MNYKNLQIGQTFKGLDGTLYIKCGVQARALGGGLVTVEPEDKVTPVGVIAKFGPLYYVGNGVWSKRGKEAQTIQSLDMKYLGFEGIEYKEFCLEVLVTVVSSTALRRLLHYVNQHGGMYEVQ